ncbi:Protein of unknown function DUF721/UPF0232 [Rhabdaerophilaceae bacterium]
MPDQPPHPFRRKAQLQQLSALVPAMIEPALRQRGFASAAILAEWTEIAGAELARYTTPLEIRWPKRREQDTAASLPRSRMQEKADGATLVIACPGAFALDAQMASARLIEAANQRFGFRAVTKLEIRQILAPEKRKKPRETPIPDNLVKEMDARLGDITDEVLRKAMSEMAAGIAQRAKRG